MSQPTPPVPAPLANMGQPVPRYEARAKVTGATLYASDTPVANPLYAYMVTSGIAKGRIAALDTAEAAAVPGVVRIYTQANAPKRQPVKYSNEGGYVSSTAVPLAGPDIRHDGEIVAMVVADSYEAAREAAHRVAVRYAPTDPSATIGSKGVETIAAAKVSPGHKDKKKGDAEAALKAAPVTIDAIYMTPTQHHNPMELFATTAEWKGDALTLYEPSQFVFGLKNGIAAQLGVDPAKVHVVNPYVGGAFGSKGVMTQRTALIAGAARELGRPVKCALTRDQGFTLATYRAETKHHIRMGAARDGKLLAYSHEGWEVTSRTDDYMVGGTEAAVEMWNWPAIWSKVNLVRADRNTPGFMRSPPEVPYIYALETAMDEMAVALKMDPIEFRRINDTMKSPVNGAPYTSRSVMQCFDQAAASFGWSRRTPAPMSMRDGDWLIGYGTAMAVYPSQGMPASARVRLTSDGHAHVQCAAHDVGTGAYTVLAQVAAVALKLPVERVTIELGDTSLPAAPVAGGSVTTASAGSAIHAACEKIARRFGNAMPAGPELAPAFARLGTSSVEEYAEWAPSGSGPDAVKDLYKGKLGGGGGGDPNKKDPKPLMYAFGAEFVEVRINARTREIRVPRMTGAFAAGHIMNPRTARSQYMGGMIWGMASALLENTELDERRARYVNDNIAEYLIAVNADVPQVDIIMVPEVDRQVNVLGVKGIGELANVGTAAAVSNAVYHATGKRIRDLPITMDKLI